MALIRHVFIYARYKYLIFKIICGQLIQTLECPQPTTYKLCNKNNCDVVIIIQPLQKFYRWNLDFLFLCYYCVYVYQP